MTEPGPGSLIRGTLADQLTLMTEPPSQRVGYTYLDTPPQPAAGGGYTRTVDNAWWERILSVYFTYTAAAGGGNRQVTLQMLNGDGVLFNQTPALVQVRGSEVWNVSADLNGTSGGPAATSISATGTAAAPGAGGTVTSMALQPGLWTITWNVSLSGTLAAADQNNFQLKYGSAVVATSDNPGAAGGPWIQNPQTIDIPAGGATLNMIAIGAATAGSTYDGAMTATPAGPQTAYPQLPAILLRSGWQLKIAVANPAGADQVSAIAVLVERYPSNWADGGLYRDESERLAELLE